MGEAKRRGDFDRRKAQALAEGREKASSMSADEIVKECFSTSMPSVASMGLMLSAHQRRKR